MQILKLAGLFAASLLAGQAQAVTLDCTLKPSESSGGYVTERYILDYNEAEGTAVAVDSLIQYFHGGPVPAKLSDNTAKKTVFTWTVLTTSQSGQVTKMQFRAAVFKSDNSITVSATPGGGYGGGFEARGKCKKV